MPGKPALLCVDDRQENLAIRKKMLEVFGCEVTAVNDSLSALKVLSENRIDLVVIDYHLAEKGNGEDLARTIRASRPKLPLIMLTGDPNVPDSVRDSVDVVLIKGVSSPVQMLEVIRGLLPDATLRSLQPQPSTEAANKAS